MVTTNNSVNNKSFQSSSVRELWAFPDNTINALVDIQSNQFYAIKCEWYEIDATGALVLRNSSSFGSNFFYTTATAAIVCANSTEQYVELTTSSITNMATMTSDSTKRQTAITTLINFCLTNTFTGISLDTEIFSVSRGATVVQYQNYLTWVTELGNQAHVAGLKVSQVLPPIWNSTTTTPPPEWNGRNSSNYYQLRYEDFENLPIDYLCLLAFDYQFDEGAGTPNSPIQWSQNSASFLQSKISNHDRIIIGLPSAGYSGPTQSFLQSVGQPYSFFPSQTGFSTATRDSASGEMNWKNVFANATATTSISGGATSLTLTGNWGGITDTYEITFSNGDTRTVNLTNGSTAVTWTGGLSSTATTALQINNSNWFMDETSMLLKMQGVEQVGVGRVSLWYGGGSNKYGNQRFSHIRKMNQPTLTPVTPHITFSTDYPASGKFVNTTVSTGSATYTAAGLTLSSGSSATASQRNLYTFMNDSNNYPIFNMNPTFTCNVSLTSAATLTGEWYCGLNNITVNGAGHTFTDRHVGFKMTTTGGVTTLSATQADGTTETAVALTTVAQNDNIMLMAQVSTEHKVVYYYNKNFTGWSDGFVIVANIPVGTSNNTPYIQQSVSNKATANAFIVQSSGVSVTY